MFTSKGKKPSIGFYFLFFLAFVFYSSCGIFAKLASAESLLCFNFILFYTLELLFVAMYAFLWQIILKKIDLSIAYMCKSITIVFSLLIAHYMFNEVISIHNIIGSLLIICGIIVCYKT